MPKQTLGSLPERDDAFTGEEVVDEQCHDDTDCGIEDTVQRVADVGFDGRAEQHDAQHDAARLNTTRPEILAEQDQIGRAHV